MTKQVAIADFAWDKTKDLEEQRAQFIKRYKGGHRPDLCIHCYECGNYCNPVSKDDGCTFVAPPARFTWHWTGFTFHPECMPKV